MYTKYSKVFGISNIDFTPLETIVINNLPSSVKSAEISIEFSTSLWTPPMPPVANTSIPTAFEI